MTPAELKSLIQKLDDAIPELKLKTSRCEEYCTVSNRLYAQVESGEARKWTVVECLRYFQRYRSRRVYKRLNIDLSLDTRSDLTSGKFHPLKTQIANMSRND